MKGRTESCEDPGPLRLDFATKGESDESGTATKKILDHVQVLDSGWCSKKEVELNGQREVRKEVEEGKE